MVQKQNGKRKLVNILRKTQYFVGLSLLISLYTLYYTIFYMCTCTEWIVLNYSTDVYIDTLAIIGGKRILYVITWEGVKSV